MHNLEKKRGKEFKIAKSFIEFHGRNDYQYKKAIIFRENYVEEMKKYEGFANYDLLVKKFNELKDPLKFYNHVKGRGYLDDLTHQSDEEYSQERFNQFVLEFIGEDNQELEDVVSNYNFKSNANQYIKYRKNYKRKENKK